MIKIKFDINCPIGIQSWPMVPKEAKVGWTYGDPDLLGKTFYCGGVEEPNKYPLHRDAAGTEIRFATFAEDGSVVDDRKDSSLKGCIHYTDGACGKSLGEYWCPVAGVVNIAKYGIRLRGLRKLPLGEMV